MPSDIAEAREVEIETSDDGRTYRTIIWVVADGDDIFVRSVRGDSGKWYSRAVANPDVALVHGEQQARFVAVAAVDDESVKRASDGFIRKYPAGRSVDAMVDPDVLHTTMRLDPV